MGDGDLSDVDSLSDMDCIRTTAIYLATPAIRPILKRLTANVHRSPYGERRALTV